MEKAVGDSGDSDVEEAVGGSGGEEAVCDSGDSGVEEAVGDSDM